MLKITKVKDSDQLKNLAYKFGQLANYFDRANSAQSRNLLSKEDDTKVSEFISVGQQLLTQLTKETEEMKKRGISNYNEDVANLINDGCSRMHFMMYDYPNKKNILSALSAKLDRANKNYQDLEWMRKDSIHDEDIYQITLHSFHEDVNELDNICKRLRLGLVERQRGTFDIFGKKSDLQRYISRYAPNAKMVKATDPDYIAGFEDSIEDANDYIYLFPSGNMDSQDIQKAKSYGLKYLGKNHFQGENNLVIKGSLNNLKRYAKEYLNYDLHPDYLYKENEFAGEIEDSEVEDAKSWIDLKENDIITSDRLDKSHKYKVLQIEKEKFSSYPNFITVEDLESHKKYQIRADNGITIVDETPYQEAEKGLEKELKDSLYINGTLAEFNPADLVNKVKQRQENLHTNRVDKSGMVHTIFIDANGPVEQPRNLWIDIIKQDEYGQNQKRTLLVSCDNWDEAIKVMNNYKRKHMNDSLTKEEKFKKLINVVKATKDAKVKDSKWQLPEDVTGTGQTVKSPRIMEEIEIVKESLSELKKKGFGLYHTANGYYIMTRSKEGKPYSKDIVACKDSKTKDDDSLDMTKINKVLSISKKYDKYDPLTIQDLIHPHPGFSKADSYDDIDTEMSRSQYNEYIKLGLEAEKIAQRLYKEGTLKDSKVNDSPATSIFKEIQSNYPGVKFTDVWYHVETDDYGKTDVFFSFYIIGNLPSDFANFKKYLSYLLYTKHGFKRNGPGGPIIQLLNKNGKPYINVSCSGRQGEIRDSVKDSKKLTDNTMKKINTYKGGK